MWEEGFLGGSVVKNLPANMFDPRVGKIPWRMKWQPTPIFLPGKSQDRGAWQATAHGFAKQSDKI